MCPVSGVHSNDLISNVRELSTKIDNQIANQVDKDTINKLIKATEELTEELRERNKGKQYKPDTLKETSK